VFLLAAGENSMQRLTDHAVVWSFLQQLEGIIIVFLLAAGENSMQRLTDHAVVGVFSNN
jgi:predicted ABC-type exoprotein transport system permease subunit